LVGGPHNTRNIEYLKELVINIEGVLSRPDIVATERRFKAKLTPKFAPVQEGYESYTLMLDYHLKE